MKASTRASLSACVSETHVGFIGYAVKRSVAPRQDLVRIFINCEEKPATERAELPEPRNLRPPANIRFLHVVDVLFDRHGEGCRLRGLDTISAMRKFNRFLGSLVERAREQKRDPNGIFRSVEDLLGVLARVKNVRRFSA